MSRVADLTLMRFCTVIEGNLSLTVSDSLATDADYNVFNALEEIKGAICLLIITALPMDNTHSHTMHMCRFSARAPLCGVEDTLTPSQSRSIG